MAHGSKFTENGLTPLPFSSYTTLLCSLKNLSKHLVLMVPLSNHLYSTRRVKSLGYQNSPLHTSNYAIQISETTNGSSGSHWAMAPFDFYY